MPLFSIVIPTYNRLFLLQQTLASIWNQTFLDFEVIVIDDGSTDGTQDYLKGLGEQVQFLRQNNNGPGAARNQGINKANGQYIAFLDSDDLWFPWTLSTYATAIEKANNPAFLAGKPFRFIAESSITNVADALIELNCFRDYFASGDEWRWWGVSSFVIKTEWLRACGGFLEENINGEDADLALSLGEAPGFVQIFSPYTFGYREHSGNVTNNLIKSYLGISIKIQKEHSDKYPGGKRRALERWRILTRHARPVALECLNNSMADKAWRLYRETFRWHLALGRWKFLIGFPLQAILKTKIPRK